MLCNEHKESTVKSVLSILFFILFFTSVMNFQSSVLASAGNNPGFSESILVAIAYLCRNKSLLDSILDILAFSILMLNGLVI
ncbi:unknown [Bacteroides sp. CAG:98]|nr:unknown [Bacteroides sp. CAG:98]